MEIVAVVQLAVSIAMFVALLLTLSVASETKYTSLYLFAVALFLLSGWTYLHFLANEYHAPDFYIMGNIFGFLSLVFISFFVTYSEYETIYNLKNIISIIFFTTITTYVLSVPSMFVFYISTTSDYVLFATGAAYNILQLLFIMYVGFLFMSLNVKITKKVKGTYHVKYGDLLILAVFLSFFVFTWIIILRVLLYQMGVGLPYLTLEYLLILYYLSTFSGASLIILALSRDSCIFCILPINVYRIFVFYKGGIPIFSYRFSGARGASDELSIGAISSIEGILSEIVGTEEEIQYIALKKHVLLLKSFENLVFVLIAERPTKIVVRMFGEFVKIFVDVVGHQIVMDKGKIKLPTKKLMYLYNTLKKIFPTQGIQHL